MLHTVTLSYTQLSQFEILWVQQCHFSHDIPTLSPAPSHQVHQQDTFTGFAQRQKCLHCRLLHPSPCSLTSYLIVTICNNDSPPHWVISCNYLTSCYQYSLTRNGIYFKYLVVDQIDPCLLPCHSQSVTIVVCEERQHQTLRPSQVTT